MALPFDHGRGMQALGNPFAHTVPGDSRDRQMPEGCPEPWQDDRLAIFAAAVGQAVRDPPVEEVREPDRLAADGAPSVLGGQLGHARVVPLLSERAVVLALLWGG